LRSLTTDLERSKIKVGGFPENLRGIYILTISISLFLAPNDYWGPKFFETKPLYTWSLIAMQEAIRSEPSNYKDISLSVKNSCDVLGEKDRIIDFVANSSYSPYEKTVLTNYTKYFACSGN
jgi:hypothetical protein